MNPPGGEARAGGAVAHFQLPGLCSLSWGPKDAGAGADSWLHWNLLLSWEWLKDFGAVWISVPFWALCLGGPPKHKTICVKYFAAIVAKLFRGRNEGMWYGWRDFCTLHYFIALAASSFEMGEPGPHQLWEGSNLAAGAQVMPPHPRVHTGIILTSPTTLPKTRTASLQRALRENRFAAGVGMFMYETGLKHCCLFVSKRWD